MLKCRRIQEGRREYRRFEGKKDGEFDFERVKLEIPVRHSREEMSSRQWDYICLERKVQVWAENVNPGLVSKLVVLKEMSLDEVTKGKGRASRSPGEPNLLEIGETEWLGKEEKKLGRY